MTVRSTRSGWSCYGIGEILNLKHVIQTVAFNERSVFGRHLWQFLTNSKGPMTVWGGCSSIGEMLNLEWWLPFK